jgi:hypothetical protein
MGGLGAYFDAFVGNPPFAGKNAITESSGERYIDWLMAARPEVKGRPNTDLCAYFFRRAADLLGEHGAVGFVATNTIAEGDSRLMSLKALIDDGAVIYDAQSSLPWPGEASVSVAVVHVAVGRVVTGAGTPHLDGRIVKAIDSRLTPHRERPEPNHLQANANRGFVGGKLIGAGLAVSLEEHAALVRADPKNAEVLRPYLGGEETNRRQDGAFERYMIDFTTRTLEEARQWPMLMEIIEAKVRPARAQDKRGTYKTYWWRPGESGGALYEALRGMSRCLVTSRHTKHLAFSFKPTLWFFSEGLNVFAFDSYAAFAVLQSRIHEVWARLLSSSLEDRLRYSASDCFETFPFPDATRDGTIIEAIGQRLYVARTKYMADESVGLTAVYNRLKDPRCDDARVIELRRSHEELDGALLDAYEWNDIDVPAFVEPTTDDERAKVEAFSEAVLDRLFALNAERAEDERRRGLGRVKGKQARAAARRGKEPAHGAGQGQLPGVGD